MTMTIGALSRQTGVHIETIRYYEKIGLMAVPDRSPGGHRVYDPSALERLNFIHRARGLGFSLENIRKLLALSDGTPSACEDVRALTLQHVAQIEQKIADLTRLSETLKTIAANCRGGVTPDCPIIEALNRRA